MVNDTHQTHFTCEVRWDLLGEERGALKLTVSGRGIIGRERACEATALSPGLEFILELGLGMFFVGFWDTLCVDEYRLMNIRSGT